MSDMGLWSALHLPCGCFCKLARALLTEQNHVLFFLLVYILVSCKIRFVTMVYQSE